MISSETQPLVKWDSQGTPYSVAFDDMYFCAVDGYSDARHVFCGGNRLEQRFKALDPHVSGVFTIIDTGFGTGLVFCVAWQLWQAHAPRAWTLNFVSVEKYPLSTAELTRALSVWTPLQPQADALTAVYQVPVDKVTVFDLDTGHLCLTFVFDDIVRALEIIAEQNLVPEGVDAIFLDGFSPQKNPEMWTEEVFSGLARLSNKATTCATFTVAGWVRRGLEAQGFSVRKVPGFGCKNEMLVGFFRCTGVSDK